jgi:hypothetical protein
MANGYGLKCPKCGNTDELNIECRVFVTVVGNRVQDPYDRSKYAHKAFSGWQWGDVNAAQCPKCEHEATVADFKPDEKK